MPNSSTTPVIDSSTTTSSPVPLSYGYVWATGKRAEYFMLQNTGNTSLDFSRVGIWLLGEGEWDGCHELWINDNLVWRSEWDDPTQFHFHRGTDAIIGSGLTPYSSGPDQGVDSFFQWFPSAIQPLCYSRIAYYAIFRKQPIQNQTNDHQNDPTQWTDINPVGLWRGLRTRLFDDQGNMTGYAFNTNPAWHFVDALLRRKLMPEFNINFTTGIDDLTPAVRARFDWGSIYESAQYFDQLLANGRRRFTGNYSFTSQTTLAAILEQILKCCRSYMQEYAGKIYLICDQPRSSVFTFSREHIMPGSFAPNDKALNSAPNCYVAKFRDLLVPAAAQIAGITCADHSNPVVTTVAPHPFNTGDRIAIGGTNTIYDGTWTVASVPSGNYITSMTLVSKGSNYPANVGAGGSVGLLYSRFKERAPQFDHQANQYARGAVGVGIPRQRNRVRVEYDYAVSTFDQASRITRFERDKALGLDQTPYITPRYISIRVPRFARDAAGSGVAAVQLLPGARVTINDTANYAYAGDYEILKRTDHPYVAQPSGEGDTITLTATADGGEIEFDLGPYNEAVMYDSTDPNSAGWSNVPGSDPGNDGNYTAIDLADNGKLAFLSGAIPSGATFDLPSTGFSPANLIAWAGPQGYIEKGHPMHVIQLCDIDQNRRGTLNYVDGSGNVWNGDMNIAAVTWMGDNNAASTTQVGGISYLLATLAGGEQICFGKGVLADGTTIQLPAGFTMSQMFAVAFPHDAYPNSNDAHGVGSFVDGSGVVHLNYQDGSGNVWHGNATVLVFAWKNNSGQVTTQTVGSGKWMLYQTSTGFTLGVGVATLADSTQNSSSVFQLPSAAGAADSLQLITSPHDFQIVDHPAHGVGACYIDANLKPHMMFEDGEGNVWYGDLDVFALFYEPTGGSGQSAGGISVTVSPAGMSVPVSGTQQYSAYVSGTSNTAVTWSVDGIAGGNSTVGTIDATGLYTAPATSNTHIIRATSQANSAAYGQQLVTVGTGSSSGGGSGITVTVIPLYAYLSPGDTQLFSASVSGTSNTAVTWSVDGITGGNSSVGTVDDTGLYTAPNVTGSHRVIATSQANTSAAGSASVTIGTGGYSGGGGGGTDCTIRGTLLDTPDGRLSNEVLKARFDAGEKVFLSSRNEAEEIIDCYWVWVDHYQWIEVEGHQGFGCSDSCTLMARDTGEHRWCSQIESGTEVETTSGWRRMQRQQVNEPVEVLRIHLAGPSHEYMVGGVWTHNYMKTAPNQPSTL
jgi:hypothetical protein